MGMVFAATWLAVLSNCTDLKEIRSRTSLLRTLGSSRQLRFWVPGDTPWRTRRGRQGVRQWELLHCRPLWQLRAKATVAMMMASLVMERAKEATTKANKARWMVSLTKKGKGTGKVSERGRVAMMSPTTSAIWAGTEPQPLGPVQQRGQAAMGVRTMRGSRLVLSTCRSATMIHVFETQNHKSDLQDHWRSTWTRRSLMGAMSCSQPHRPEAWCNGYAATRWRWR